MGDPRREIERPPLYDFRFFSGLSWENSILDYQSFTGKFTSMFTITSKFTNILGLDCIGIYYFISIIFHGVIQLVWCFFWEIPPFEELQGSNSSPRRAEVGRRTLGAHGSFLLPFFCRDRFQLLTRVELAR